jgi:hypothetical protein
MWSGKRRCCKIVEAISSFSIIGSRFYIPKKYRLIEFGMQGGYPQKSYFFEIV